MSKDIDIILKLIALTQDKNIVWEKGQDRFSTFYKVKINDTEFTLGIPSIYHLDHSFFITIDEETESIYDDVLLEDLHNAITYDERKAKENKRNEILSKGFDAIASFKE